MQDMFFFDVGHVFSFNHLIPKSPNGQGRGIKRASEGCEIESRFVNSECFLSRNNLGNVIITIFTSKPTYIFSCQQRLISQRQPSLFVQLNLQCVLFSLFSANRVLYNHILLFIQRKSNYHSYMLCSIFTVCNCFGIHCCTMAILFRSRNSLFSYTKIPSLPSLVFPGFVFKSYQ